MSELFLSGVVLGTVATIAMDLWALLLHHAFGQNRPNWAPAGRWFRQVARGRFRHASIAEVEAYSHELTLGWFGHYAVGIVYGIVFVWLAGPDWLAEPSFLPAFIFGIVTVGAGWFIMQPGMGLGIAASKTPNPTKVRLLNLAAHTVFALGLYGAALALP